MTPETVLVRDPEAPERREAWAFSPFDRVNAWLTIRGTWLFDQPLDADVLKEGLGRLLAYYPHLGGRFAWDVAVALNNAGVPFSTLDRPDLSLADVVARPVLAGELNHPLDRGRVKSGKDAPLAVRLTRLADGSALGVRSSHACLDGRSFYAMVRDFGALCAGRAFPRPVLDQGRHPLTGGLSKAEAKRRATDAGWTGPSILGLVADIPNLLFGRLLTRTPAIHLPADAVAAVRQEVRDAAACAEVSTSEALGAVLAALAPRLHGLAPGTPCQQVFVADVRERVADYPLEFVGNASFMLQGAHFSAGASLAEIASDAHARLAPLRGRPSAALREQYLLGLETMRHTLYMAPYDFTAMHLPKPTLVYLNDFSRLPVYDVDFGTAERPIRPVRAIPHDLPDPWLIWPAPPALGGVEVYLTGVAARVATRRLGSGLTWEALRGL